MAFLDEQLYALNPSYYSGYREAVGKSPTPPKPKKESKKKKSTPKNTEDARIDALIGQIISATFNPPDAAGAVYGADTTLPQMSAASQQAINQIPTAVQGTINDPASAGLPPSERLAYGQQTLGQAGTQAEGAISDFMNRRAYLEAKAEQMMNAEQMRVSGMAAVAELLMSQKRNKLERDVAESKMKSEDKQFELFEQKQDFDKARDILMPELLASVENGLSALEAVEQFEDFLENSSLNQKDKSMLLNSFKAQPNVGERLGAGGGRGWFDPVGVSASRYQHGRGQFMQPATETGYNLYERMTPEFNVGQLVEGGSRLGEYLRGLFD